MQHSTETNVYEPQQQQGAIHQQISPVPPNSGNPENPGNLQSNYLSSSLNVQQPLPASTMASSVAALQRLSASIDVSVSRSNSRASAYEDNSTKESEKPITSASTEVEAAASDGQMVPQYLKEHCVVYTFYGGDLSAALEDHFNRSLEILKRSSQEQEPGDSPNNSDSATQQRGKLF